MELDHFRHGRVWAQLENDDIPVMGLIRWLIINSYFNSWRTLGQLCHQGHNWWSCSWRQQTPTNTDCHRRVVCCGIVAWFYNHEISHEPTSNRSGASLSLNYRRCTRIARSGCVPLWLRIWVWQMTLLKICQHHHEHGEYLFIGDIDRSLIKTVAMWQW